jgi:ribosomal protein L18
VRVCGRLDNLLLCASLHIPISLSLSLSLSLSCFLSPSLSHSRSHSLTHTHTHTFPLSRATAARTNTQRAVEVGSKAAARAEAGELAKMLKQLCALRSRAIEDFDQRRTDPAAAKRFVSDMGPLLAEMAVVAQQVERWARCRVCGLCAVGSDVQSDVAPVLSFLVSLSLSFSRRSPRQHATVCSRGTAARRRAQHEEVSPCGQFERVC